MNLMIEEGIILKTGMAIGRDISAGELTDQFDAVCIAIGAGQPRELPVEGRDLSGIHHAMEFLTLQNRVNSGSLHAADNHVTAEGRKVIVIGGGDTGSDCVGTSTRQKAQRVMQIEILPKPPDTRKEDNPWPYFGKVLKTSTSHEEGCERLWSISTLRFLGENNQVTGVEVEDVNWKSESGRYVMEPVEGTKRRIDADLVLLALGFVHPVLEGLLAELDVELNLRKNIKVDESGLTSREKIFAAGDSVSGASLVVNAIASGRRVAVDIDRFLRK
jgi:glutamate synthase (NADPH/NADH) small chain